MKKLLMILIGAALAIGIATVSIAAAAGDSEVIQPGTDGNVTLDVVLYHVGDVNADGDIDVIDLQRLYAHLNDSNPLGADDAYGDVNEDTEVDVIDLQRLYAHLNDSNSLYANP